MRMDMSTGGLSDIQTLSHKVKGFVGRGGEKPNQEHKAEGNTIGSAILGRVQINMVDAQWVACNLSPKANIGQPCAAVTTGHNDDHVFCAC